MKMMQTSGFVLKNLHNPSWLLYREAWDMLYLFVFVINV